MIREFSITKQIDITIRNKLIKEKRDINVYHHTSQSAHIISCNSSITRGIKTVEENDYLHISVDRGRGHLNNDCILDLPSFVDFRFSLPGEITLVHDGERILIKIPPGPPIWELKMTIPKRSSAVDSLTEDQVTIGDIDEWPDSSYEGLEI
jgi:hypothetical protein